MRMLRKSFDPDSFIKEKILEMKKIIGNEKALAIVSGGVDSSTTAFLAYKAIGNKLSAIFIDTGFMKKNQKREVIKKFKKFGIKIECINSKKRFLKALSFVQDPESKKQIFRKLFYSTVFRYMKEKKIKFLLQGFICTDYPLAVSVFNIGNNKNSKKVFKITTLEPLRSLSKEEVKKIAKILGIKDYKKPPFPGMGFANYVIGEITEEKINILRKATEILERETKKLRPFECFPVLLEGKITGIRNNKPATGYGIALRIVTSKDSGRTAKFMRIPYRILDKIQRRILNEIPEVIHVFYSITNKPPATIQLQYGNFGLVSKGEKHVINVKGLD
jgi:GMP synthase (glutamine-hydrolysing)